MSTNDQATVDAAVERIAEAVAAPVENPAAKYLARLDLHLPKLATDKARRVLLAELVSEWEARKLRFGRWAADDNGPAVFEGFDPPPTAFDFLEIITGLLSRKQALLPKLPADPPALARAMRRQGAQFKSFVNGICPTR